MSSYEESLKYLSYKTGLSEKDIEKIYTRYWMFIKKYIKDLNIKSCATEQELQSKRPSIVVRGFGRFFTTLYRINKINKRDKRNKRYVQIQKNKAAFQSNNSNS